MSEQENEELPPDTYKWRLEAKFVAYVDVGISSFAVMLVTQNMMAMATDEDAAANISVTKIMEQVASGSMAGLYAAAAKSLMNSAKRGCDPNEALKQAVYWRKIHLGFILVFLVSQIGILLNLVPIKIFAFVLVGFVINVFFIFIVVQYIKELEFSVKCFQANLTNPSRQGGHPYTISVTNEPPPSPLPGPSNSSGIFPESPPPPNSTRGYPSGWSKVWME